MPEPVESSEHPSSPGAEEAQGAEEAPSAEELDSIREEARKTGYAEGLVEGRRAAYIVQLIQRTDADVAEMTEAETTNLRTSAMTRKGQTYFGVWYEDIRDQAVIEQNEEVIGAF